MAQAADPVEWPTKAGDIALVYDWCHDHLSGADGAAILAYLESWVGDVPKPEDISGWGNYWPRYSYSWVLAGLAAHGHHVDAQLWFDTFRQQRFAALDLPLLDRVAAGGGWPEGMIYDWIANAPRVKSLEAWRTAAGEDLFRSTPWFEERLGYLLLHRWPGTADQWGDLYHPYASIGDTERRRGSVANHERIMALILISRFAANPLGAQLQAYLATGPTAASMSFLAHDEFLWYDPGMATSEPGLTTHMATATGTLLMRSGWPSGAADTDPHATHLSFQCGDHFTYHQHYDQNHFTLYRGGDLLVDSGVYSGEGLSDHDINYYVRTIAHNTLVVFNPAEDFSAARPDATSNDGGQRSVEPASRSPWDVGYFDQHAVHYETGDIDRFGDGEHFTWVRGDATAAYNNTSYNQAMDTQAGGNTAKVDHFQRELVYLRPSVATDTEMVILYDRVGVVDPAFSGAATKLLFHTLAEPAVSGSGTVVSPGETLYSGAAAATTSSGGSHLHLSFLLPAAHNLRKVGGRGDKAFWVFDANHDWHWDPSEPQPRPTNDFEDLPYGEWRLELEPADQALDHNFLTTLEPTSQGATPAVVSALSAAAVEGVHLADPELARVALFSTATDGSPPAGTIAYDYPVGGATLNLVFDLSPGARYELAAGSSSGRRTVTLTPDGAGELQATAAGVLVFTLDDGLLFRDGFESGNTSAWSGVAP